MAHEGTLYGEVADRLLSSIENGAFRAGDRLPSIRTLSRSLDVSINTVKEAYGLLESQRFVEARPQSGWFVRRCPPPPPRSWAGQSHPASLDPRAVTMHRIYGDMLARGGSHAGASLAIARPDPALLPARRLAACLGKILREQPEATMDYQLSPGLPALRGQIARHYLDCGLAVSPDEIIITSGGSEAMYLAILALCKPGEAIAIETPTYFNFLLLLLEMGIRVVEIPTSAAAGPNLGLLESALGTGQVKAFLSIPNYNNPLGFCMADSQKQALVALMERYRTPLIEDDIYGDLPFAGPRPTPCKSWDASGNVILASSFSKTIAPGYRVGWIMAGRWQAAVDRLKSLASVATATPTQQAIAAWLASGGYPRHLRGYRRRLAEQTGAMAEAVARSFPRGTGVSRPHGGFVLWVELPAGLDSLDLFAPALDEGIIFSPGQVFSASGNFSNCLRLNAGVWNPEVQRAVMRLGELARNLPS